MNFYKNTIENYQSQFFVSFPSFSLPDIPLKSILSSQQIEGLAASGGGALMKDAALLLLFDSSEMREKFRNFYSAFFVPSQFFAPGGKYFAPGNCVSRDIFIVNKLDPVSEGPN